MSEKRSLVADGKNKKNSENKEGLGTKIKEVYNDMFKDKMAVIMLYFFVWLEFVQVVYLYEKLQKYEKKDKNIDENKKESRRIREEK